VKPKSFFSRNQQENRAEAAPRDAATVILLRDRTEGPYELFLMQRHLSQAFMGGAHVFPGGSLDESDADPGLAAYLGGFCAAEARLLLQELELPEATALGLFLTAIRETFEEAGVLLARGSSGEPIDLVDPGAAERFAFYRVELHERRLTLADLARREGILYAPDLLIPYSHWITPETEPRRFDTRFFLARFPERQVAVHDRMELTESCWMTTGSALADQEAGRIALMPPSLKTIEELHVFPCIEPLFASARSQRIHTILPEAFWTADSFGIRLPHDSEYTLDAFKRPPRPGETSRIVMQDRIWKTFSV
jgi:8-oxo-dGTP pyrophosphatase MutT (NUDIX family)